MHHNVLLIAAGLICSPVFAAPNINNRPNPRRVHRQRQAPAPILSLGTPFRAPFYEPPSEFVSLDDDSTSSAPPDSTSAVIVDPLTPIPIYPTSPCSVIRITEYVTVYDTASSTSSPANLTSAPYGWNSSTISSGLLTGTGILVTTTTSQPYFPITNSTTSTLFGTDGTGAPAFANTTSSAVLPPNNTLTPSNFTSFPNITTPTLLPTSAVGPTLNLTSFVNVSSTPYVTPTPLPANFTSFPNASSTPEISILPIPTSSSSGNVSSIPSPSSSGSVSSIPSPLSSGNVSSIPSPSSSGNVSFIPSTSGLTVTSIVVSGTSSSTTTFTSLIIDTNIPPMETASPSVSSTSSSLVIVTTVTPIATASSMPPEFPTTIITASGTVSSAGPGGTPSASIHCGIHGTAMGVYYLATYAYNRANTPVTLQGCYQFCAVAVERCYSYEFYLEPGLDSPRCKLYGGLVAYEVDSVDPYQPNQWFDVACGDPTKYV